MKTTSKCQVTLPRILRTKVGITPRQEVDAFVLQHEGRPVIAIAPAVKPGKGAPLAARWVGCLKESGSTDEILRGIRGHG